MKLSLLTLTLLSSVRGNIFPNEEITSVPGPTNVPIVDVRTSLSPILSTSILPPRRDLATSTDIFDRNDKIEPISIDKIGTARSPPLVIISPKSRSTELESSRWFKRIPGIIDGSENIVTIERNDEIVSDDTSNKLFLCGSLPEESIVSREGSGSESGSESGSVSVKGASRVAVIDDAQNSAIVCPPNANLSPPPPTEQNTRTHEIDYDRKLSTLPPIVPISESPKIIPSNDPPVALKDYLIPPYSYWQR